MTPVTSVQSQNIGLTHHNGLTPDGMVLYLQSQLGDIDAKIDGYMVKQKTIQAQRTELNAMATVLAGVAVPTLKDGESNKYNSTKMDESQIANFNAALAKLEAEFPLDANTMSSIKDANATKFKSPEELKGLQTAVENALKDLESSASLDMIQLQSCGN
jgi:hypothetical protein